MAKVCLIVFVAMCAVVASVMALPRQYRYYPPTPNRFAGWTVTSQELLALPSQNDPANLFRVAPPAGFLRQHHVSRRSVVPARFIPAGPYGYLLNNENGRVEYFAS